MLKLAVNESALKVSVLWNSKKNSNENTKYGCFMLDYLECL